MIRGRHGRSKSLKLDRQLSLRLDAPVEHGGFTRPNPNQHVDAIRGNAGRSSVRGTFPSLESLAAHVQSLDRLRLLEPTSLPKVLRGWGPRPRPQTAIISYAAQRAYERRMALAQVGVAITYKTTAQLILTARSRRLNRLAARLRKRSGE